MTEATSRADFWQREAATKGAALEAARGENTRLQAEVASLRLTLGGRTFSATIPEPSDCALPGASPRSPHDEPAPDRL